MDRGEEIAAERNAGQESEQDRIDALPYAAHAGAIDEKHVEVQRNFHEHKRWIEDSVRQEEQPDRHGQRGKAIAEGAIHEGGEERDERERDEAGFHKGTHAKARLYSYKD